MQPAEVWTWKKGDKHVLQQTKNFAYIVVSD